MTVKDYLLKETKVHQLCMIKSDGYVIETAYIDWEDLFLLGVKNQDKEVKNVTEGGAQVRDSLNRVTFVPVTYIEV